MKKILPFIPLILMICLLSSCAVVGGIFKAGVWVGVLYCSPGYRIHHLAGYPEIRRFLTVIPDSKV